MFLIHRSYFQVSQRDHALVYYFPGPSSTTNSNQKFTCYYGVSKGLLWPYHIHDSHNCSVIVHKVSEIMGDYDHCLVIDVSSLLLLEKRQTTEMRKNSKRNSNSSICMYMYVSYVRTFIDSLVNNKTFQLYCLKM